MQIAWLLLIRELSSQIAIQNQLNFDSFTTWDLSLGIDLTTCEVALNKLKRKVAEAKMFKFY